MADAHGSYELFALFQPLSAAEVEIHFGCTGWKFAAPGQEKHKDWHATLGSRRLSDLDAAARWKMIFW